MFRKLSLAIFVILLTTLLTAPAFAANEEALNASRQADSQRTFAPVQGGFTTKGQTALPYAPNRLLVQVKFAAAAKANLGDLAKRGAQAPGNEIGLESLDELADAAGVISVERPYIEMKNVAKAGELGVD